MYDVEKLVGIACDCLDNENNYRKYNISLRKKLGLLPTSNLWIPSLNGNDAYRLGELAERSSQGFGTLSCVCEMLDVDQHLLNAAVKSMQRKERHNGRWDNPNYTCWMSQTAKKHLARFLRVPAVRKQDEVHPWFSSTGRKKTWCED